MIRMKMIIYIYIEDNDNDINGCLFAYVEPAGSGFSIARASSVLRLYRHLTLVHNPIHILQPYIHIYIYTCSQVLDESAAYWFQNSAEEPTATSNWRFLLRMELGKDIHRVAYTTHECRCIRRFTRIYLCISLYSPYHDHLATNVRSIKYMNEWAIVNRSVYCSCPCL